MRASLYLWLVSAELRIAADIGLMHQAKRTNDGERHLAQLQTHRHSGEMPLVESVHQGRVHNIVHMMPECYLIAPQLLREI